MKRPTIKLSEKQARMLGGALRGAKQGALIGTAAAVSKGTLIPRFIPGVGGALVVTGIVTCVTGGAVIGASVGAGVAWNRCSKVEKAFSKVGFDLS